MVPSLRFIEPEAGPDADVYGGRGGRRSMACSLRFGGAGAAPDSSVKGCRAL
jgi:hypothetical protein